MASSLDADWGEHRETALTRPVSRVGLGNVASLGNATGLRRVLAPLYSSAVPRRAPQLSRMTAARITVLMSVHNGGRWLRAAIDGVH